ncbi:G-type lectin S-receptor-like serine/threonine-protein kinase SD1-1 [Salvia miltiorrhiza]|uniref:G-type lectin S-receptor-like serine/threonine-protein kinase SD1-1 n=1 Tax=Salvia miltiorrhiza TaxID=226208 RepID=UPI0025ACF72B|nr:G-type lectin S-receptor-like serine/threonine-protein kinase SD1-1 [Salvia miltiorrhiza]
MIFPGDWDIQDWSGGCGRVARVAVEVEMDFLSCTAYVNPYVTGLRLVVWGSYIGTNLDKEHKKKLAIKLISASLVVGVLIASIINGGILYLTRRKWRVKAKDEDIDLPTIKMAALVEATNNFSSENMIGSGGLGSVYKGKLSTGQEIAVKRLSRGSNQGVEEFKNEIKLIAKLQHRNLVRLVGCCIQGEEMVLIYEYLQHKSLDCFISGAV